MGRGPYEDGMCDLPEEEFAEYLLWRQAEASRTTAPVPRRRAAVSDPLSTVREAPAPVTAAA